MLFQSSAESQVGLMCAGYRWMVDNDKSDPVTAALTLTSLHPTREFLHTFGNMSLNSFSCSDSLTIFIDGSKTEFGVASTFCAMESCVLVN